MSFARAETFPNPRFIPASSDPTGIYIADINNDGRPDIIYGNYHYGEPFGTVRTEHVLLAQPDGSYQALPAIPLTANTRADCFPLDVNGDRKIDLVCSEYTTQTSGTTSYSYYARTLLGNGDGTFQPGIISSFGAGQGFVAFDAADFNHDGNIDIAVSITDASGGISNRILLGDGTGRFTVAPAPAVGFYFSLGDVNNDGWTDFIDPSGPFAALNKHDGTFTTRTDPTLYGVDCISGDVDNDGKLDVVCNYWNSSSGIVAVRGNGDGTYDVANPVRTTPSIPTDVGRLVKLIDLNHDGLLDVVSFSSNGLTVFMGKGNLQFNDAVRYNLPGGSDQFYLQHPNAIGDLNGDGNYDIVASGPDGIYVTYGRDDGSFAATHNYATVTSHTATTATDFNGDGLTDLISLSGSNLYFWANKGDGSPGTPQLIDLGSISVTTPFLSPPFLTGDFDGDGKKDLIISVANSGNQIYLLQGKGNGSFSPIAIPSAAANGLIGSNSVVADLNADGRDDVIRTDTSNIYAKLALPGGSFAGQMTSPLAVQSIPFTSAPFAVADFDHDGKNDVAVALQDLFVQHGNGDGTFGAASAPIAIPYNQNYPSKIVYDVEVGDFDGDDNPDIAVLFSVGSSSDVAIYYGDGGGNFSSANHLQLDTQQYSKAMIADLDGDGRSDLILTYDMTYSQTYSIAVIHALDNRSFGALKNYVIGRNNPFLLVPMDLNKDGFTDLVVGTSSTANTVLLNDPGPVVGRFLAADPEPSAIGQSFTLKAVLTPPPGSTIMPTGAITFSIDRIPVGTAILNNGSAAIAVDSVLALGSHKIRAYWPGDSHYPSIIFSATHTVRLIPVAINFTGVPSSATVGDIVPISFGFSNGVSSPSFPPTGSYTVLDGMTVIASGPVTATTSSVVINESLLSAGTHGFAVNYTGDTTHSPSMASVSITVNPAPSTTALTSSSNPSTYGQTVSFTATITPGVAAGVGTLISSGPSTVTLSGLPGGPVTLPVMFPAGAPANASAAVTYSPPTSLLPGTYPFTATFSGNMNLVSSSGKLSQVVNPPPVTMTLEPSATPWYANHLLTLTVRLAGVITTPTGVVQLTDGTSIIGTLPIVNGIASFSTRTYAAGSHTFRAEYSGDNNNAASSATLSIQVLPYDFAISASPSEVSFSREGNGTTAVTVTGIGGFAETVTISANASSPAITATVLPATLQLTAGGSGAATIHITRTLGSGVTQGDPELRLPKGIFLATLVPFALLNRRRKLTLMAAVTLFCLLGNVLGCNDGSFVPEAYTVQVTATSADTSIAHTLSIPVTVTR